MTVSEEFDRFVPRSTPSTCAKKVRHETKRQAENAALSVNIFKSWTSPGRLATPYHCVYCKGWHTGRKPTFVHVVNVVTPRPDPKPKPDCSQGHRFTTWKRVYYDGFPVPCMWERRCKDCRVGETVVSERNPNPMPVRVE